MSEYWKSTPKYWCKHCKTYVRDTKLEKSSHEATPKHQGNLKRFLRDLHRGHEREEREKQRAKDEVERLNGVVNGSSSAASGTSAAPWQRKRAIPPAAADQKQASLAERKQQLSQLAEMGVAIPDEFRGEMAMAGNWQTLSERPVYEDRIKKEDEVDIKPDTLSTGVRKRKYTSQEEDDEAKEIAIRQGWGSTTRTYPDAGASGDDDLEGLLERSKTIGKGKGRMCEPPKVSQDASADLHSRTAPESSQHISPQGESAIKKEDAGEGINSPVFPSGGTAAAIRVEQEEVASGSAVIFKKRKAKPTRQK
ncbi:MAG: hypothetical protein M1830_006471 [Pleopsidium flavum]|nr:MAG: hypothetical protein M1830_006471 [Pleopsidium flavum]